MKKEKTDLGEGTGLPASAVAGIIALVFLIIGYQTALFVHNAVRLEIAARKDHPDTVFIFDSTFLPALSGTVPGIPERSISAVKSSNKIVSSSAYPGKCEIRRNAVHSMEVERAASVAVRQTESFRFNPNTVSVHDMLRLGLTMKQAEAIDRYRKKGGHFHRKSDFGRSYVVSDSLYARLEPFIEIPLLELNAADSASLDALPGIGGYFASAIIRHRKALGGFSYKEQLMDVYKFDKERYDRISDLVFVSRETVTPYPLWSLPADSLKMHPYIHDWRTAKAIVLYRENNDRDALTLQGLLKAGILTQEQYDKFSGCELSDPQE